MTAKKKMIFVNQVCGYLTVDIINVFAENYLCELYTGQVDLMEKGLDASVKVTLLKKYERNSSFKRIYTWCFFSVQFFSRLIFKKKDFELFVFTNPPFAPFIAWLFNKTAGVPYHLLIYDVYPDALVNFKVIKKRGIVDRLWSWFNAKIFKKAASVFTLSKGMEELILRYCSTTQVQIIPNWTATAYFPKVKKSENPFALKYRQQNKITVMYSGNMGATHSVEIIAELAKAFLNDPLFHFLLIGDGVKKNAIEGMAAKQQLTNLTILPFQTAGDFLFSVSTADIGIVTLSSGAEDLSVPSKTYNLLAAGVALLVIAPDNSALTGFVKGYKCGRQFTENNIEGICGYLHELSNDPAILAGYKKNALIAASDFTPANAEKYAALLYSNDASLSKNN